METISGIIIAGGHSQRLGQDKRELRLWGDAGPNLLEHTVDVLASICTDLIVVLNDAQAWQHLAARLVPDEYDNAGVLGGIYAGLAAATSPYALVVAADMPLLNRELLRALLRRPRDYDALVPRSFQSGAPRNPLAVEPLHAIYSQACLAPIRTLLDQGQRRVTDFLAQVHVEFVEPDEIARYDPNGYSFLNVNTPDELATIQQLIGGVSTGHAMRKVGEG